MIDQLNEIFDRYRININQAMREQLCVYCDFLLEYNKNVNLTAVTDPGEVIEKHFADSLSAMALPEIFIGAKCADVGTGAGFPGVPLAIARPDIQVVLVDSLQKRLVFLEALKEKLHLQNIYTVHGRSEDLAHEMRFRQKFDCVFSRAVARLNVLSELDLPFVKKGGYMLAWKGPSFDEEVTEADKALRTLGGKFEKAYSQKLDGQQHYIVSILKTKDTPACYPRQAGTPKRKPL